MPESLEAEAAVLGSMILDRECIGQVIQLITSVAFYRPEHREIFDALVALYESNSHIDLVLLRDELKKRKKLKSVGGAEYLVRVVESVPSSASVEYYCDIVKNKSLHRQLVQATSEILNEAYDESGDVREKLNAAEQKIFAIVEKKISGSAVPLKNLLTEVFESIDSRDGLHVTGLPSGYHELDGMLCGLQKSEMIIIAGRPSMGKTSFALNIAEHIGADRDIPVVIFSLETSKHQLVERFLCSRSRVDLQRVKKGTLDSEEYTKLKDAGSELYGKPIFIDDTPGLTPLEILAKCRRLKSQYDIQCVLIDYLQLMSIDTKVESRQQEVSTISRHLKALAKELNIPIVVLSQLNRSPEHREGHRPRMSDLRESGSIEQDADVIMLLHREDYYSKEVNKEVGEKDQASGVYQGGGEEDSNKENMAEIIIAKQRNGPVGTIKLYFDKEIARFENLSQIKEPF